MVQRRLGRGLDFLLSGQEEQPAASVTQIPLQSVDANPYQPRRTFTDGELGDLAASIREHGVLQPITVRRLGDRFQVIAGERRLRACESLGLDSIPAIVREANDAEMLELALIENVQREDLNPMELARAYHSYMEKFDLTQDEVAKRIGKSRSAVANMVRLLDLPADLQELVSRGTLTMGHARALLGAPGVETQRVLAARVAAEGLSVRDAERLVQESSGDPREGAVKAKAAHLEDLEQQLRERLGTRVSVADRGGKGRIVIEYFSREECDRLVEQLLR